MRRNPVADGIERSVPVDDTAMQLRPQQAAVECRWSRSVRHPWSTTRPDWQGASGRRAIAAPPSMTPASTPQPTPQYGQVVRTIPAIRLPLPWARLSVLRTSAVAKLRDRAAFADQIQIPAAIARITVEHCAPDRDRSATPAVCRRRRFGSRSTSDSLPGGGGAVARRKDIDSAHLSWVDSRRAAVAR